MRLVSWNIRSLPDAWRMLASDPSVDVALLQEAKPPPSDVACQVEPPLDSECRWTMPGWTRVFRTAIARLSDRVTMRRRPTADLASARGSILPVSRVGTLAVAGITRGDETITCISAYAPWENAIHEPPRDKPTIFSDASAHRLVSDISPLITCKHHKVLVAGDFNTPHGYGEDDDAYWRDRYATVFTRLEALGLRFVGPRAATGRRASPRPDERKAGSESVPALVSNRHHPEGVRRPLDFVFASESIVERVSVRALDGVDEWGPSDRCRVVVDIAP